MANPFDDLIPKKGDAPQTPTAGTGAFDDLIPKKADAGKPPSFGRSVGFGMLGFNDAVAGTLGAPVDLAAFGLRQLGVPADEPIGGSRTFRDVFDYIATLPGRAGDAVSGGSLAPFTEARTARDTPSNFADKAAYGVGSGVGGALSSIVPASWLAKVAAPMSATQGVAKAMATAPATQAGLGALSGAVSETTGEPLLGLATGFALPASLAAARNIIVSPTAPFTDSGRQRLVAQLIAKSGGREADVLARDAATAAPRLQGAPVTTAEATRNAGIAGLERGSRNDPLMLQQWSDLDAARNAARVTQLDTLPPAMAPAEAGDAIRGGIQHNRDLITTLRSQVAEPMYAAARMSGEKIDVAPVVRGLDAAISESKGEIQSALKKARAYLFNAEGAPENTVAGVQAAHKAIGRDISVAARAGDNETARALQNAQQTLNLQLEREPLFGLAQTAYREASQPLSAYGKELAPRVADTLRRDSFNTAYRMAPEMVPGQFWRSGDQGGATMRQFLNVAGNRPEAMDAMLGHAVADFRKVAFTPEGAFRPTEAARWMKTHDAALTAAPTIRSAIDDAIRPVLSDVEASRFARDAGRAVGSNTVQNALTSQVMDNMLSGLPLSRLPLIGPLASATSARALNFGKTGELLKEELTRQLMEPAHAASALRRLASNPATRPIVDGSYLPALANVYGAQSGR